MLVEERRNRLLDLVRIRRFISLPELAEELEVSESTVRRDVEQLEEQGTARRIHGGVLYAGRFRQSSLLRGSAVDQLGSEERDCQAGR